MIGPPHTPACVQVDTASWGGILFSSLMTLIFASILQIFIRAPILHMVRPGHAMHTHALSTSLQVLILPEA